VDQANLAIQIEQEEDVETAIDPKKMERSAYYLEKVKKKQGSLLIASYIKVSTNMY